MAMNKKQLIAAWIVGVVLCGVISFAPQKHYRHTGAGGKFVYDSPEERTTPEILWDFVLQRSAIVLVIGALAIYTLKDKKS